MSAGGAGVGGPRPTFRWNFKSIACADGEALRPCHAFAIPQSLSANMADGRIWPTAARANRLTVGLSGAMLPMMLRFRRLTTSLDPTLA